ncbi:DNA-directed RNA polymerase, mitochondrial [Euwallacea fornicatus]|uniref:DNA-directed RNA polymerase, mitochondrial n=1 Tax=Euwallacea fornicatus TaxID=995702 RepID=UPI00338E130E
MFLLFRRSPKYFDKSLTLSLRNFSEISRSNVSEKTCLLCKRLNTNFSEQYREQSSVINPSLNNAKKKRLKKRSSKYTDILEVTNISSYMRKANVTKLKPSDLNLLASSDINLNELYKLKCLSHTYSNLISDDIGSYEAVTVSPISSDLNLNQNSDISNKLGSIENGLSANDFVDELEVLDAELEFKSLDVKNSLEPEVVEDLPLPTESKEKNEPVEEKYTIEKTVLIQKHRDVIAAKTLAAYSEVCNHLKNPHRGLHALYYHQSRVKKNMTPKLSSMRDLNVYYTLLKGFANNSDYHKIEQVLKLMKDENIEPDLNCYTAIFECLGRVNFENHYLKEIRIQVKEAVAKGITFDRIMNEGIFLNDSRVQVLKAFRAHQLNYSPKFEAPRVFYDNPLVNHLNSEEQLRIGGVQALEEQLIPPGELTKRAETQLLMEEKGYITVKSIETKDKPSSDVIFYRSKLEEQYKSWAESTQEAFKRDLASTSAKKHALTLEPYLRCVPSSDVVEIIVQEAKRIAQGSETYSPEVHLLHKMLGTKLYMRYKVVRKQKTGVLDQTMEIHKKYCENYATSFTNLEHVPHSENFSHPRIQWQLLQNEQCKDGATLDMAHQPWPLGTLISLGRFLYHIIIHDLKVDVNAMRRDRSDKNFLPAFYTIFRNQGRIVKEEIKPHPVLSKLYKASQPETLTFPANEVPMVCPPVPWTSIHNGGYLISPTDVVRLPFQAYIQKKRLEEVSSVQLYPDLDALNQLALVPWKVNTKVLDVILGVFRNGGSSKLDVPQPPSSLVAPSPPVQEVDKEERYNFYKLKLQHRRKQAEMFSLWCDCLYRLSLANHFRNDIFWLPHNMDFRGRVYPVPPHLNHLGSDLARSMLIFAQARPLGPSGLDWLKIHLINLTGLKKRDSLADRLAFANDIIDLILDSANNPLEGKMWWIKSDEPWQTLACCMEIADVLKSGIDPALYRSHFPVHQDGSCNGLQHYAALGRDNVGAYSVNLAPSDVPQDVYSAVVALVEEERARDDAAGIEIAKVLNGFIKRKVIKQTIMTTVYGVTKFGARLQIAKQLKDIDDFPKESIWAASSYLTARTFESLRSMFTSTREIQDWFTECARLITGVKGSLLEWVTPLGLPVVQPYIKFKKVTGMPLGYDNSILDQFEKPNTVKQKNAFPPNFIHSLDSSHMMLTSLLCARAGITFVSVHDCYWTHPSTIHIMNKICREQFVALHSVPILEDLSAFLLDAYARDSSDFTDDDSIPDLGKKLSMVLRRLPRKGDFDINNVLSSVYFFS